MTSLFFLYLARMLAFSGAYAIVQYAWGGWFLMLIAALIYYIRVDWEYYENGTQLQDASPNEAL